MKSHPMRVAFLLAVFPFALFDQGLLIVSSLFIWSWRTEALGGDLAAESH
jgi:hypothetical protein